MSKKEGFIYRIRSTVVSIGHYGAGKTKEDIDNYLKEIRYENK